MAFHKSTHPLIAHKLGILRDKSTSPSLFRTLMTEIGYLLSYEATASLTANDSRIVDGVFFKHPAAKLSERIGVFPILRAGLGLSESFLSMIPSAQVYHLGLYRDHVSDGARIICQLGHLATR